MNHIKAVEYAEKSFKNIKDSIKGLYEIININLDANDIYFQAAEDNIQALYQNILELLLNEHGLTHLIDKIKNSEIELDIVLNEVLANYNK